MLYRCNIYVNEMNNILIINFFLIRYIIKLYSIHIYNGDWGLGIGDWGLGIGPNPQSPIPNPQSPIPIYILFILYYIIYLFKNIFYI